MGGEASSDLRQGGKGAIQAGGAADKRWLVLSKWDLLWDEAPAALALQLMRTLTLPPVFFDKVEAASPWLCWIETSAMIDSYCCGLFTTMKGELVADAPFLVATIVGVSIVEGTRLTLDSPVPNCGDLGSVEFLSGVGVASGGRGFKGKPQRLLLASMADWGLGHALQGIVGIGRQCKRSRKDVKMLTACGKRILGGAAGKAGAHEDRQAAGCWVGGVMH
ncbi:hypothetical protein L7F22_044343 [Adiantum nelumboides]|nr:hypothetical protein [Adiantum nelumboides]